MKSGERLDQIEPLIAEMLIKIDVTAAKVDNLIADVSLLKSIAHRTIEILENQGDQISFLLKSQLVLSNKQKELGNNQKELNRSQLELSNNVDKLGSKMDQLSSNDETTSQRLEKIDLNFEQFKITQEKILVMLSSKN